MPTIEIDGRAIEVADGLTVIQAADQLGVEIPHYCYHPGLSISGNCRMCLVEIEKMPKLQIACNTRVTDGMKVSTQSEKTKIAQKAVLEFLLINHPIDCPICDQAGECKLQEYYMDYDRQDSRVELEQKTKKGKALPIGPLVMLDQERCILCARCTRFLDEVTKTSELGIYQRGDHSMIELAPGKTLDNKYSANVVDICPVGALTSRDFRFRARVWYQERTPSVCSGCAQGCNIEIFHREGRIFRYQPRQNLEVNDYWMCDAGRLSYKALQGEGRLMQPFVRGAERFAEAAWPDAIATAASRLTKAAEQGAVGIIVSARASNEEIALARRLANGLGAKLAGISWSPADADHDDFLIQRDKNPNTRGLVAQGIPTDGVSALLADATAGKLSALVVIRTDLTQWVDATLAQQALEKVACVVVLDSDAHDVVQFADVILPIGTHAESDGTFTNVQGRVQRFWPAIACPGEARPGWNVLASLAAAIDHAAAPESANAAFVGLAAETAAFSGLSYGTLGTQGVALPAA
jgi:NADH-quinone oxidoreductase subunit G